MWENDKRGKKDGCNENVLYTCEKIPRNTLINKNPFHFPSAPSTFLSSFNSHQVPIIYLLPHPTQTELSVSAIDHPFRSPASLPMLIPLSVKSFLQFFTIEYPLLFSTAELSNQHRENPLTLPQPDLN